ncbi:hypothetical protein ACUNEX_23310, partial [Serratia sp. IR-2025]
HGVPLCFFGEKKRTRTGSWPLLSYAPWVLQLLSEFAMLNATMEVMYFMAHILIVVIGMNEVRTPLAAGEHN